jgi:hypothetical protein
MTPTKTLVELLRERGKAGPNWVSETILTEAADRLVELEKSASIEAWQDEHSQRVKWQSRAINLERENAELKAVASDSDRAFQEVRKSNRHFKEEMLSALGVKDAWAITTWKLADFTKAIDKLRADLAAEREKGKA